MAEEKTFEHRVERWLESVGVYPAGCPKQRIKADPIGWYFKVFGGGFQRSGIPDLILNIKGHFVAVELKAERGKASELQKLNIHRIRDSGGDACVLYPSGFEEFKTDITRMMDRTDELLRWTGEQYKERMNKNGS